MSSLATLPPCPFPHVLGSPYLLSYGRLSLALPSCPDGLPFLSVNLCSYKDTSPWNRTHDNTALSPPHPHLLGHPAKTPYPIRLYSKHRGCHQSLGDSIELTLHSNPALYNFQFPFSLLSVNLLPFCLFHNKVLLGCGDKKFIKEVK